jgi:hypothetical protein
MNLKNMWDSLNIYWKIVVIGQALLVVGVSMTPAFDGNRVATLIIFSGISLVLDGLIAAIIKVESRY